MSSKEILTANDLVFRRDAGPGRNPPGVIVAANESRFVSTHYSEPLTAYIVGWQDPAGMEEQLNRICPLVPVGRRFEFKKATNSQAFLAETGDDDVRAIGATFKRVEYRGSTVNEKTLNKGLTTRIDRDEEFPDNWQELAVQRLKQRLIRAEFLRVFTILSAAASNSNVTWDASHDPDGDVITAISSSGDAAGIDPNIVVMGSAAWQKRALAYRTKDVPYAGAAGMMTPNQAAALYGVDAVEIVRRRYQSSKTAKSPILGSVAYIYHAELGVGRDDPSSIKRFYTPTDSGAWRVYVEEHDKYVDISVEHYSNIVATSTVGVQKLTVS